MNHQKPEVGQFFIEKEYSYNSIWLIKIIQIFDEQIEFKIMDIVGNTDKSSIGRIFSFTKFNFYREYRNLTDNEKVELL